MTPTESQLAWVAGLIEGEGWIGLRSPARPVVQVITTDEDVAQRLYAWTGLGNVGGPYKGSIKPFFKWTVDRRDDSARLLRQLLPWLCERRAEKARGVLAAYDAAPPTLGTAPTCGRGHALEGDNLRIVDGRRRCLLCQARRQREHRQRKATA